MVAGLAGGALLAGTVDAIAGGGGLITVPLLLATGLPPYVALGTNKAQSCCGTAAALATYWRRGAVTARWIATGLPLGAAGAVAGATLVHALPERAVRSVVMVLLVVAAAALWVRRPTPTAAAPGRAWVPVLLALGLGAYDGFFGPGTGAFLIVGLVLWAGRAPDRAAAEAKAVNLGSNLGALAVFAASGDVAWQVAAPMAVAQIVGGVLGARLALRGGARLVRVMVLLVAAALWCKLGWDLLR